MTRLWPGLVGLFISAGAALAQTGGNCMEAGHLVRADAGLPHAAAAVANRRDLRLVVVGTLSSMLAGPGGTRAAYPVRLQSALAGRLPGVGVSIVTRAKPKQTAPDMVLGFDQLLMDQKPDLVLWQTGTADAIRGVDLEAFRAALEKGVVEVRARGADVVLMNMQYSPRTESMIAAESYAETMRGVALQQEIPLFDRFAVMKEWNDRGIFDLSVATKKSEMAEQVHDCIGRLAADLVIDAIDVAKEAKQGQ